MRKLKMVLIMFGVIFVFLGLRDVYYNSQSPSNYNEMQESDFQKGMIVEGDLYGNLGSFEENYTTRNGVKTSNSQYNYMIPVGETQYMGLLNDTSSMETELDNQADITFDYMLGESDTEPKPVHFKGRVVKMSDETKGYMRDYMVYLGFAEDEVDSYILPYYIKCENYENGISFALVGLVCLVIGLLLVIIPVTKRHKEESVMFGNRDMNNMLDNTYRTIENASDSSYYQRENNDNDTQQSSDFGNFDSNTDYKNDTEW